MIKSTKDQLWHILWTIGTNNYPKWLSTVTKNERKEGYFCLLLIIVIRNGKIVWKYSLRHVPAEFKEKVPDVSDSLRNIGKLCNSKLKSPKFKDLCTESIEKLLKDEAATRGIKKMFLKIMQYSQETNCVGIAFLKSCRLSGDAGFFLWIFPSF